jgi:NifU-like protein involved in Fe-S cluster formation
MDSASKGSKRIVWHGIVYRSSDRSLLKSPQSSECLIIRMYRTVVIRLCGDLLELQIQVQDGIITDVRFKVTRMCGGDCVSSMTTVLYKGQDA